MAPLQELTNDVVSGPAGQLAQLPIHVECEVFTGSLALLLGCVKQHKVDLLGIPLFPICEGYYQYLAGRDQKDLDEVSAVLIALAYLIERKAWLLLPAPEIEEEPLYDEPGLQALPLNSEFGVVVESLKAWHEEREQIFFRQPGGGGAPYELPLELGGVSAELLASTLERLLSKAIPDKPEPLGRPRRSLAEQMELVWQALPEVPRRLEEVITLPYTRMEVVWWFLALLELIRLGQAHVEVQASEVLFARGKAANPELNQEKQLVTIA